MLEIGRFYEVTRDIGKGQDLPVARRPSGQRSRARRKTIELAIVALLAEGHLLIEDVPGRGQNNARPLRWPRSLGLQVSPHSVHQRPAAFRRFWAYRFTARRTMSSSFKPGPIFANIVSGRRDQSDDSENPERPARGDE